VVGGPFAINSAAIFSPTCSKEIPAMRTRFSRAAAPVASVTAPRGRWRISARKRQSSALALPSTGGDLSRTLSASPSQPTSALLGALGTAFIVSRQCGCCAESRLAGFLRSAISGSLGECGVERSDEVFDGLAADREAQEFGLKVTCREFAPTRLARHEIVVGEVDEGAKQRGLHAEARALGQGHGIVKGVDRSAQREGDEATDCVGVAREFLVVGARLGRVGPGDAFYAGVRFEPRGDTRRAAFNFGEDIGGGGDLVSEAREVARVYGVEARGD